MPILILLIMLMLSGCVSQPSVPQITPQYINYSGLISQWIVTYRTTDAHVFKVKDVQFIHNKRGVSVIRTFLVYIYYEDWSEAFLLYIDHDTIQGWSPLGEAPDEEIEEPEYDSRHVATYRRSS